MSADAKLKAYIDRVLNSREREDAEKANTKEIYAELAGEGYDKTIVGKVVNHLRKDQDKVREQSEVFDLYMAAYLGASHVHTRVREAKPNSQHSAESAEDEAQVATVGATASANSSRATVGSDRPASGAQTSSAGTEGDEDRQPITVPRHDAEEAGEVVVTAASSSADIPEPALVPSEIAEPGDRSAVPSLAAAPVVAADRTKPHPWCNDPDDCGVEASWNHMCLTCHRRMEKAQAERASSVLQ